MDFVKFGFLCVLFLFLAGLGIQSSTSAPQHAIVLIDSERKVYFAPQCVFANALKLRTTTLGKAREEGFRPDPACVETGAFMQDGRSLPGLLLERMGILKPANSRWNPDGSWNSNRGGALILPGKMPEQMAQNVYTLAQAGALLQICFQSPKFTLLSNSTALELHALDIRIRDLITKIGAHYSDQNTLLFYETTKVKMADDASLKKYAEEAYDFCRPSLFSHMHEYVSENEEVINQSICPCGQSKCKACTR